MNTAAGSIISSKLSKCVSVFGAGASANVQQQQQSTDNFHGFPKSLWSPLAQMETVASMPRPKLRQIRIYLCSTFTDFKAERDIFWSDILPEFQLHCLQYGVDVFVFDPYQGASSDTVYKPHLFREELRQIGKCSAQSEGIFFVCLIGDKYGPCPLPLSLKPDEFQQVKTATVQKDQELLNTWYKLDQNCVPPLYKLQDTKNKKFNQKTYQQLWCLIRNGLVKSNVQESPSSNRNQTNNDASSNGIFLSAVEQCIQCALQSGTNSQSHCLFVARNIDGVPAKQNNSNLAVYFDGDEFVEIAREKLTKLKAYIQQTVDKPNLETFKIVCQQTADANEVRLNEKEWEKYMEKFAQQILYKLKQLVDRQYASGIHWGGSTSSETETYFYNNPQLKFAYQDTWRHYQEYSNRKTLKFFGQADLLSKLKDNCKKCLKKPVPPIVVHGDDATGKTSLLCEAAFLVKQWLGVGTVVHAMFRFVNINACSKFAHELLRNLCIQLCSAFELTDLMASHKDCYSTDKIIDWFDSVCTEASKKLVAQQQMLLICVDDLHLLKYGVHAGGRVVTTIPWIPETLPRNIVFFGTVGRNFSAEKLPLKNVQAAIVLQMQPYKDNDLYDMTKHVLDAYQKCVSHEQEVSIKKALKLCPNPLYALLLGREASKWSCQHTTNGQGLPINVGAFVEDKLQKLEKIYGYDICSSLCTFLECGHYGLTEGELMDLMGENREMVQKTYSEQGLTKMGPFPTYLWLMLKDDFGLFLNEMVSDGKIIYSWSHTIISNAIRYRYLRSSLQLKKCHCSIANLYQNSSIPIGEQPTVGENEISCKFSISQPMWTFHPSTGEILYSRRATQNLWYHLLHSGSVNDFEEQSLCNFVYLEAVLNVTGLVHLISIMEDTLLQLLDHNLHILYGTIIRPAVETLSFSANQFAAELIGRLNYTKNRNTPVLNGLLDQAMAWVDNECTIPLVVPLTSWLRPPLCPLVVNFQLQDWTAGSTTLIQPTINYQHLLVAGMPNGRISMYHILTNTVVKTFAGHTDRVLCLELSHNGHIFATGSLDLTVRTWDIQQGNCVRSMNMHTEKVLCMLFTDNDQTLFTGSADCSIKMTSLENGQTVRTFIGHTASVNTLAINNRSEYLISGSSDFVVLVWNIEKAQSVSALGGLMAPVSHLALTANDTFLLVACADETLRVYSLCLARELHELRGHEGTVSSLVIAPDDCQVFAGTSDGHIYCYDLHDAKLYSTQNCHTTSVSSLKITKDGHFLISSCSDNIHVWNIDRPTDFYRQDSNSVITIIAMSRDFKYIASGNMSGTICLWDVEFCQCVWAMQNEPRMKISHLSFDNETNYLFAGQSDGSVCVWSMTTGHLLRKYKSHACAIKNVQLFSDKSRLISHDSAGVVKIWRLVPPEMEDDDKDLAEFRGTGGLMRLANDKDVLASVSDISKEIRIWNISNEDSPFIRAKLNHNDAITCMVLPLDGKFVVTGSQDQSLKVWEVATGYLTQILVGHEGSVICCAVSDDCQIAASGATDKTVYAWEIETGSILSSFCNENKDITSMSITHDGFIAFSGYKDGWLHAWSTETGRKVASFNAHAAVLEVLVSREAHRLVLRLDQCSRVVIVCLHNSPSFGDSDTARRRKRSRALSISSLGSTGSFVSAGSANPNCAPSSPPLASPGLRSTTPAQFRYSQQQQQQSSVDEKFKERWNSERIKERKQLKVFANIEHSRSRGSLYDSSTSSSVKMPSQRGSQHTHASANQNNASKICRIV